MGHYKVITARLTPNNGSKASAKRPLEKDICEGVAKDIRSRLIEWRIKLSENV